MNNNVILFECASKPPHEVDSIGFASDAHRMCTKSMCIHVNATDPDLMHIRCASRCPCESACRSYGYFAMTFLSVSLLFVSVSVAHYDQTKWLSACTFYLSGGPGQISHLAPTYASVLALCIIGKIEAYEAIDRYEAIYKFMLLLCTSGNSTTMLWICTECLSVSFLYSENIAWYYTYDSHIDTREIHFRSLVLVYYKVSTI